MGGGLIKPWHQRLAGLNADVKSAVHEIDKVMATMLHGVGANDLSTYAIVVVLLGGAALLASYVPALQLTLIL